MGVYVRVGVGVKVRVGGLVVGVEESGGVGGSEVDVGVEVGCGVGSPEERSGGLVVHI